ncbi:nucleotide sugar dehydrogenase [SAR86 cluster bacterium]|nr:nucleotide sugar dehydrogenase [SAR86 cluster bacterium]
MINKKKVTIVGSGYVGMSLSILFSQNNDVVILDIDPSKVDKINRRESTIADADIEIFLEEKNLSLSATTDKEIAYRNADFIIIATPTNYDFEKDSFDTSSVDTVTKEALDINQDALIVIKSTIPVGHTELLQKKLSTKNIIFSPEFLREGQALKDNLYPSRIIIGSNSLLAKEFSKLLQDGAEKKDIETLFIGSKEAEAVKLFANSYLAMRVAFFNELDSYALTYDLDSESIINGVCHDNRIGNGYNNPSFGYGGYCLPKDTKQLLSNFDQTPQSLIESIISSNEIRIQFMADEIIKLKPKIIGFYRLIMKQGSKNFRSSAIQEIIKKIQKYDIEIIIYEPTLKESTFNNLKVAQSLEEFKSISDIIVSNRNSKDIEDVKEKIFTRDIFNDN